MIDLTAFLSLVTDIHEEQQWAEGESPAEGAEPES